MFRLDRSGQILALAALGALAALLVAVWMSSQPPPATPRSSSSSQRVQAKFTTLGPGAALPSGAECAARVRRSPWEPRPANTTANQTLATPGRDYLLQPWQGGDPRMNSEIQVRIDGQFTGTTDEIIQWAACKWGFDEDIVRAQAVKESNWRMDFVGDNGQSFGIMQIKSTMHQVTYPATARSTAFNLDYALAWRRACYEGYATWMGNGTSYAAGFEWGCVGAYYSGGWYDAGAQQYIQAVQANLQNRAWLQPTFSDAPNQSLTLLWLPAVAQK